MPEYEYKPPYLEASQGFVRGLFGLVTWELALTAWFEVSLVARRRTWSWYTGILILARVSLFVLLLLCAVGSGPLGVTTSQECQSYVSVTQVAEALAITCASFLFSLRVCALWKLRRRVMIPLCILALGQLAICMLSVSIMKWGTGDCWFIKPVSTARYYAAAKYIYTLGLDTCLFIFFILALVPLPFRAPSRLPSRHPLTRVLTADGLLFFACALAAGAWQTSAALAGVGRIPEPYTREVVQNFAALGTALRVCAAGRLYARLTGLDVSPAASSGRATRGTAGAELTDPASIFAGMSVGQPSVPPSMWAATLPRGAVRPQDERLDSGDTAGGEAIEIPKASLSSPDPGDMLKTPISAHFGSSRGEVDRGERRGLVDGSV